MLRKIIRDAYQQPRFGSDPMKQGAVTDYAAKTYLECVSTLETLQ